MPPMGDVLWGLVTYVAIPYIILVITKNSAELVYEEGLLDHPEQKIKNYLQWRSSAQGNFQSSQ
jgi:hypothetical protein